MSTAWEQPPEVPDLLRRFVLCPYQSTLRLGTRMVNVETNDPAVVQTLPGRNDEITYEAQSLNLKVVVDGELVLPVGLAPVIVDTGDAVWGRKPGLLFAFDRAAGQGAVFTQRFSLHDFGELLEELAVEPAVPDARL